MAEAKRRLPSWMLKQKTENTALRCDANLKSEEKSDDQVKEKHVERKQWKRVLEEKSEDQNEKPVKRKQRRQTLNQDPDDFEEAEIAIRRCQTRQRNNRTKRNDANEIGEGTTEVVKTKRAQKKMSVVSDDEIDLTVDDLVSIAEEYVKADRDKLKKNNACTTTENDPSKDTSKHMSGSRLSKGLVECSTSKPSAVSSDYAQREKNNLEDDTSIPTNVGITGDPAQDMLNLFLGPLLKKLPPLKEPVIEAVEEVHNTSLVGVKEQIVHKEEENAKQREPLVKKKSSLKDQVAMFLS